MSLKKEFNKETYVKNLKNRTDLELTFIIKDAAEAIVAHPLSGNTEYYAQEILCCKQEIDSRT